MKKLGNILFISLLICGIAVVSFAQTTNTKSAMKSKANIEITSGIVTSIDTAKNEIVVKSNKTGADRTITVSAKVIVSLNMGEEVRVTLNKGSNIAVGLKKIVKQATSTTLTKKVRD
jgi:hypothetical protein